jgi:hypothetical protein
VTRLPDGFVQYHFRTAIGGFFEIPTANAVRILPPHLQPVEPHHGQSVLSVMAFDFHDSMVGAYGELILSVHVSPRLSPGGRLPRAAFYPFLLGTTTEASRLHAIERWHLPHFPHDISLEFDRGPHDIRIAAAHGGRPIVDMHLTDYAWEPVSHNYQCLMHDDAGSYQSTIVMEGQFSESEEERGSLTVHDHPFNAALDRGEINTTPFREMWLKDGLQTFHPLQHITAP